MILLNPGPVNVSDRVRQALLQPDICHRESECSELLNDIRQKLLKAFVPGYEDEYYGNYSYRLWHGGGRSGAAVKHALGKTGYGHHQWCVW